MPNQSQRFSINHAAELTAALSSELQGLGLNDPVVAMTLRQLDVLRDSLARADSDFGCPVGPGRATERLPAGQPEREADLR